MKIGMVSMPQGCNILHAKHEQTDMPHIDVFFPRENFIVVLTFLNDSDKELQESWLTNALQD